MKKPESNHWYLRDTGIYVLGSNVLWNIWAQPVLQNQDWNVGLTCELQEPGKGLAGFEVLDFVHEFGCVLLGPHCEGCLQDPQFH